MASSTALSPLLFRITGKDIPPHQEICVFGTCHELKASEYPKTVLDVIKKCNLLVSEISIELGTSFDLQATIRKVFIRVRGDIHKNLLNFNEKWFRTNLAKTGWYYEEIDQRIPVLKEKSEEFREDQSKWVASLQQTEKSQIQKQLDIYNLKLVDLDPLFVEAILDHKMTIREYTSDGVENVILSHFKDRNCPIIELDNDDSILAIFMEDVLSDIEDYSLTECLNSIREFMRQLVSGQFDDDGAKNIYYSYLNSSTPFDVEASTDSSRSVRYRECQWIPKIISAIDQKVSTAVDLGYEHLSGIFKSLKSQGYTIEHYRV